MDVPNELRVSTIESGDIQQILEDQKQYGMFIKNDGVCCKGLGDYHDLAKEMKLEKLKCILKKSAFVRTDSDVDKLVKFISELDLVKKLPNVTHDELSQLANTVQLEEYEANTSPLVFGNKTKALHIILDGHLKFF